MRGRYLAALLGGALLLLGACGGPGDNGTPPPAALAPPTNLTASAGDEVVNLTWDASTDAAVVKYNIYQGTSSGALTKIADVDGTTLSYQATGLTNGTAYFFTVDAENAGGVRSTKTAEESVTPTAPGATVPPTVLSTSPQHGAAGVGTNVNITVTFSKPMDEASTEAAFNVAPATTCNFSWASEGKLLRCTPVGGLAASESYTITIDTGAQDRDGHNLAADKVFTFTTSAGESNVCKLGTAEFGSCTFGP